ncbi:hypothetical protein [Nocardioides mesophilus]|uniref:Uncharacterized protein n=1 Tax=Nocardioides mesophilus TaxID=433659 RepID=A0A7G9R7C2_9ACTN|nr:hypothetical protein [Nocardioides mesophilus]QNN51497.1 hypothetical protein H9L09_12950 [Nocardioides mesophilus]
MKTHPLNVSYLVVGLAFLGIAGSWALHAAAADIIDAGDVGWLVPLSLVVAGVIGLVAFAAKGVSRGRSRAAGATAYDAEARPEDEPAYDVGTDPGIPAPTDADPTDTGATSYRTDTEHTTVLPTSEENR